MNQQVIIALLLTIFAGLSTGIGSIISLFYKTTNQKLLAVALGFSAGVMIYISFMEILPEANESMHAHFQNDIGSWVTLSAFFGGMLLVSLIDKLVPSYENPHEAHKVEELNKNIQDSAKLKRLGILSAIAIAVHNFPEGIATFMAAYNNIEIGLPIAIAVAIHNIPEGIAVAVPIYYATNSRKKAFRLSFLSGLAEPVGAIIAFLVLMPFLNDLVMGVVFAAVAGIMIFISLDELLPTAGKYGEHHISIYGLVIGMGVMAVSLLIL
jgi:zinc transporter, ZIP family